MTVMQKIAKETLERLMKEKELMIVKYILDNPNAKIEDVVLVEQRGELGMTRYYIENKN